MKAKVVISSIALVIALIFTAQGFYTLSEGRQAIITQFGRPIGEPITNAGLHFKVPFLQKVQYVDKRILSWDGFPNQIPTKDKKYISVDTTARWRIVDALKFIQTVRNERGAKARLDAILDSATRDVISNHNLVEAVRDSNAIIDKMEALKKEIAERKDSGESLVEEELFGDIESITTGRERLSERIVESASKELASFGINLIDVQLRRISYEKSVEAKVYERMISERQRIAQKIRSIGQGEKAIIEGRQRRDLQEIRSRGYREAQILKGEGEAKAAAIYARALGQGPRFYEFIKSMEAYKASLKGKSQLILSSDSEFLKYLKKL